MSAEKEIVNYWCNKKGFFTINNIKTSNNKDAGILALKFESDKADEMLHIEVSCSITNNITETADLGKSVGKIVSERFEDKSVSEAISGNIRQFSADKRNLRKIIVLGAVPKSRRNDIIKKFSESGVGVMMFENVLYDVFEQLDTSYYKNDIIRTLQLTKFLLLSEPSKLAKLLVNNTSSSRKEFLSSILDNEEIVKEFKKTNVERLSVILKNSSVKPAELVAMLDSNVLNKKTRKIFLNSLMEQENTRKIASKQNKIRKMNVPLKKFF